jgi:hypothetical protein
MISLATALALKAAGLTWMPMDLDFFAIPDRQMDERIFVISDMLVTVDILQGLQVVAFQGASEWALDSLVTTEAVWMPREDQLRMALEAALLASGRPELRLSGGLNGYRCEMLHEGKLVAFEAKDASEAYARALLHLLDAQSRSQPGSGEQA